MHAKFGFNFDWAGKENIVKSIELGAQVDVYYRKLPVMITSRNRPYIFNLYLAYQMGKRY
jgi:phosphopantetheinyl transferase (holo-ACP synthase)